MRLDSTADEKERKLQEKLRFAGEKVPSMKRRSDLNDYYGRHIYMVTMAVEGRRPLLGRLVGDVSAGCDGEDAPCVVPTALGQEVTRCWELIPHFHPEVRLLAFQLMPDHLHGILFVQKAMEEHLGQVISGFKAGCNKAYRRIVGGVEAMPQHTNNGAPQPAGASQPAGMPQPAGAPQQAGSPQPAGAPRQAGASQQMGEGLLSAYEVAPPLPLPSEHRLKKDDRTHGLLFERGYNDLISKSYDMLPRLTAYLRDNPRRLWLKSRHPDLFRLHRRTEAAGLLFTSLGNHFLLAWPEGQVVELSRSASSAQVQGRLLTALAAAHNGAVTYTAAISEGEKLIARTLREQGYPLVVLLNDGFPKEGSPHERYYKPGGVYFEACCRGRLLLLEPAEQSFLDADIRAAVEETLRRKAEARHWAYTPIPVTSQRYRFVALNEMAKRLAQGE